MDDSTSETVTGEVMRYQPAPVEEYRPRILLAPEEAKALDDALRAGMRSVLQVDVDYGVIPGTRGKPTLYKPGAEKLLQWFGFGHSNVRDEIERDADGARVGVTYKCTVFKTLADGRETTVSTCDGYAGYDEDRFYVSAEQAEAKERAMAARYERKVNPAKLGEYRAPWNSLIKMAQKRALVGATLQATAASGLFTQDMEDQAAHENATALATVADAIIREFPQEAGAELDRWITGQRWPQPGAWSTEQWCRALVAIGRLAAGGAPPPDAPAGRPAERMAATPADDPWYDSATAQAASASADLPWHDVALERAAKFATEEAGRELWRQNAAARKEGRCTLAEREIVETMITARHAELKDAPTFTPAEPSASAAVVGALIEHMDAAGDWAGKVEDCLTVEDCDAASADFELTAKAGAMDGREVAQIRAALRARRAELEKAAAA